MCMNIYSVAFLKFIPVCFALVFAFSSANATTIDFDDIPYVPVDPEWPQFDDVEVSDQYLTQGLLIDGGWLGRRFPLEDNVANPQFLFGGNFMRMTFVGDQLPNHVAMTVSSVLDYANIINVYGPNGHLFEIITSGYAGENSNNPYQANQPIAFSSAAGIAEITFEGYLNMRWGTLVDNLYFSTQTSVPEPRLLLLFGMALGAILFARRTKQPQVGQPGYKLK